MTTPSPSCRSCGHPVSHHRTGERNEHNAHQSRCAYRASPGDGECPCQLHRAAATPRCRSCGHAPHTGLCTARSGGTAYACMCYRQNDVEVVEQPQCDGDHFFENRCSVCGGSQPDGPCEICPHIGPQRVCSAEHFARRPCRHCGSSNLRTVRVRAPRTT
jgi:hypothetical protein